jgi:hypothetical protein
MLAVGAFFGLFEFNYNTVYQTRPITAHKTYCALDEKSPTSFKMALFQQLEGYQSRFVSIRSEADGITFSGTSFKNRRDNYFHAQFVLPSDSVPDMFRGGYRRYGFKTPDESFEGETKEWSGESCKRYYGLVAVADRLFDSLAGSRVNHKDIAWTISKDFEATSRISDGKSKKSHLRIFFFHDRPDVVIMGFNRQSLTVNASQVFRRIYEVDKQSLWRIPAKPQERDLLYYENEEIEYFGGDYNGYQVYAEANIHFRRVRPFGREQGMHKFTLIRRSGSTYEIVATPQIEPVYGYQYVILSYVITLPDWYHPDFKGWAFSSGPSPYWFRFDDRSVRLIKKANKYQQFADSTQRWPKPYNYHREHSSQIWFDEVHRIWRDLIGSKCIRSDGEEVYVAPDYQLLSYEGEHTYTKLIWNDPEPTLENCRLL